MKKYLITGAGGMVGTALTAELAASAPDAEIYVADIFFDEHTAFDGKVRYFPNTVLEKVFADNEFDVLVQLAFPRNTQPDKWADGIKFASDVFAMAKKYNVKQIINISSQSIYGLQRTRPADESHPISLNSPYTTGKYCMELLVNHLFEDRPHTNVRLSTIIGPKTMERVPNKLFDQLLKGQDLIIKCGKQIFSFLDVKDAVKGLTTLVISNGDVWREVYNIGTSESNTLIEIAQLALDISRRSNLCNGRIVVSDADIVMDNRIITEAAYSDFGWRAEIPLRSSMEEIFEYMRGDQ